MTISGEYCEPSSEDWGFETRELAGWFRIIDLDRAEGDWTLGVPTWGIQLRARCFLIDDLLQISTNYARFRLLRLLSSCLEP